MALTVTAGVGERLEVVRHRMAAAGGSAAGIRVVAVTKGFGIEAVRAAVDAGLEDFGENYADELLDKRAVLGPQAESCRWHFLGRVQRNKVARIAPVVALWQGVDRSAAGEAVAGRAPGAAVLVQVNISDDTDRNGCSFEDAPRLVDELSALGLDVAGLMAVGPRAAPEAARRGFRRLAATVRRLGLRECSMGMTDDLEIAVQEGTTMVRLGRALFGPRLPAAGTPNPLKDPPGAGRGDRLEKPRRRV